MKQLSLANLNAFFAAIAAKEALYLPVKNTAGQTEYKKWEEGDVYSDALNTVRSAKDFFFPQTENLVEFGVKGKAITVKDIREEKEDFVVFGVRACDARSFTVLDRVFLSNPVDSFYQNRREHGVIVSVACTEPEETCFCGVFGIDATEPEGDVSCWKTGDSLLMRANTEKGEALLASVSDLLTDVCDCKADEEKQKTKEVLAKMPLMDLSTDAFKGDVMLKHFNSPKWKALSQSCLGCGTCTFVCPTCQCYDIRDFDTGNGIKRFRCWDSCMYSDFTKMSAGQPRLTQLERFRQRFMHKLVYFPMNNEGVFGCVGCGRCMQRCPISMNIVKVMKELSEEDKK